jgi:hypothetical protein
MDSGCTESILAVLDCQKKIKNCQNAPNGLKCFDLTGFLYRDEGKRFELMPNRDVEQLAVTSGQKTAPSGEGMRFLGVGF